MIQGHHHCPPRPDVIEDRGAGTGAYCDTCGNRISRAETTGEIWMDTEADDRSLAPVLWAVGGITLSVFLAIFLVAATTATRW